MEFSKLIKTTICNIGEFDNREIVGCSENEIIALQSILPINTKLPSVYLDYLRICGKGFADFQTTTCFYYNKVFKLNKDISQANENNKPVLNIPKNAFVIMSHLSYSYIYIVLNPEGKSSPVFLYIKDEPIEQLYTSFEEFIFDILQDYNLEHKKRIEKFPDIEQYIIEFKKQVFNVLEFILQNNLNENSKDWLNIYKTYNIILKRVYNLYNFEDITSLTGVGAYLNLYSVYDEEEMGVLWSNFEKKLIHLEQYFHEFIIPIFNQRRNLFYN